MTDEKRSTPYVWPTWIVGLLAGTSQCVWAAWYRAHHKFQKLPDANEFDSVSWNKTHTAMVRERATQLSNAGYAVSVEEDNQFALRGKVGTLSGKPDLLGISPGQERALIVDAKGGAPKEHHAWQVKIYLFAMPLVLPQLKQVPEVVGELMYRSGPVPVILDALEDTRAIANMMKVVGGPVAPPHTPSIAECQFCNIAACDQRKKPKNLNADVSTLF